MGKRLTLVENIKFLKNTIFGSYPNKVGYLFEKCGGAIVYTIYYSLLQNLAAVQAFRQYFSIVKLTFQNKRKKPDIKFWV